MEPHWSNSDGVQSVCSFQTSKLTEYFRECGQESRCIFHFLLLLRFTLVKDLTRPPAVPGLKHQQQHRQQEADSTSIREAPTTIADSEISGSEACRDLTLWNADNTR